MSDHSRQPLNRSQVITLGMLFTGYVGYYFCRANLPVVTSQLMLEQPEALTEQSIGFIVTAGIGAYLVGKLTTGPLCDFLDGKRMFVAGMILSIFFTVGAGLTVGFVSLLGFWIGNRYAQSIGWSGLVKVSSRWFPANQYGLVLGILSLSYQFGDSLAKLCLGGLLKRGLSSQGVFLASAAILATIAIITAVVLRASPLDVGEVEPEVNPGNVYGSAGADSHPEGLRSLIRPLLSNPTFWLVCILCAGLTFIRETLNFWTPLYLKNSLQLETSDAAMYSAILPLAGGAAAVIVGFGSDRWLAGRRSVVIAGCLALLTTLLVVMAIVTDRAGLSTQLALLSAVSFFLVGPYSTLGGAIALDLGARRGGATTAGLVDSAGYMAGMASGAIAGRLARDWPTLFIVLAGAAGLALGAALVLWLGIERRQDQVRLLPGSLGEQQ